MIATRSGTLRLVCHRGTISGDMQHAARGLPRGLWLITERGYGREPASKLSMSEVRGLWRGLAPWLGETVWDAKARESIQLAVDDVGDREPEPLTYYRCGTCGRCYATEADIRAHQDLWARLHQVDPEIGEHDGQPWSVVTLQPGDEAEHVGLGTFELFDGRLDDDGLFVGRVGGRMLYMEVTHLHRPGLDEQLVRAWSAAQHLGLESEEVLPEAYDKILRARHGDAHKALARERHAVLVQIGLTGLAMQRERMP